MRLSTLKQLRCVRPASKKGPKTPCGKALGLETGAVSGASKEEVASGWLRCQACQARYPILAGVAIVVPDPREYVLFHAKGVSAVVKDAEIPREWRDDFAEAREEILAEHVDDDLESKRVVALYLMNHYLSVKSGEPDWWKPRVGEASPLLDGLIREHWDQGPMAKIQAWVAAGDRTAAVLEFGCGVGGLGARLAAAELGGGAMSMAGKASKSSGPGPSLKYLGLDSSFASIALGRHLLLGAPYPGKISIPEDLLQGTTSREVKIAPARVKDGAEIDLVVADFESPPVAPESFDVCVAMNTIDMLEDPRVLPRMQKAALKKGGIAIQSCPYIWRDDVAKRLRSWFPKSGGSSSRLVEQMYDAEGLRIRERAEHLPWLFFKHVRQLEIYSVHLFRAEKA